MQFCGPDLGAYSFGMMVTSNATFVLGEWNKYNPGSKFCAELVPKQHVCCSKGDLPDPRPPKNSDGSCHAYKVQENDNCASIAIEDGLKMEDLENFNKT
ncbi:hypothetical protein N0V84_006661 [Fusarium piperis]|uniref:LysM domain-containing protein n=1 Tax=Fusarium piperis TaxID=1435070 RepID=A0A9W9BNE2_9HYPO|nr:hypothetical protein N0V84_006661 [Fusarium piperis]